MTEQHRIILTEADNGYWTAREEPSGFTTYDATPEAALSALDHVNEPEVDPDARLFSGEPSVSVEMANQSIDDVLYGSVEEIDDE